MRQLLAPAALVLCFLSAPVRGQDTPKPGEWFQLFNGKDLTGWTPKIRTFALGDNYKNTFRVEDGLLKVRYDGYDQFNSRFGHLFYQQPFSHYTLRIEYRFVGDQAKGGPGWATRNSGVMIHGQDPATISKDQEFPVSIEVQFLGGDGKNPRPTGNLCTPGTHVVMKDKLVKTHCIDSTSATLHGEQWVTAEIVVKGAGLIEHKINGKSVISYEKPQYDPGDKTAQPLIKDPKNLLIEGGTLSLQSESHPLDFRKVEIMVHPRP